MSIKILTFLNKMSKLLTVPRFYGPVATVVFTIVYHLAVFYFGASITLSWLWLFMIAGVCIAGMRAGLICAAFTVAYAVLALPMDISRLIQLAIATPAAALLVGYLRRRERHLQRAMMLIFANGNVAKMREALALATELKLNLRNQTEAGLLDGLERIESDLGNTLAVLDGYKFLREEIERVNQWYADPANVRRLQEMKGEEG